MASSTRPTYQGSPTTLVIGIDIGTTFSGASYAVLVPHEIPAVHDVVRFQAMSSAKVPSIIYYDGDGKVLARGAEIEDLADADGESDDDEDDEASMRVKVEWFKLHLRPASSKLSNGDVPPMHLPKNGTVADVWAEFLQYMNESALQYIKENEIDGKSILDGAKDTITYVLTHPNDWKGHQQDQIRQAAVRSKLVPDTPQGRSRIEFLSEGEASFHWCVDERLVERGLGVGSHIIICDAGGGTIDVSSFRVTSLAPLKLEEAAESEARISGSVFVANNFYQWASDYLKDTPYGSQKNLSLLRKRFDSFTKCTFGQHTKSQHRIKFGRRSDNDDAHHIQQGLFVVPSDIIAGFFETSCREAVDAIRNHLKSDQHSYVFIVGGFSNSPWLYAEITKRLASSDCGVHRSTSPVAKPVARGCVTWYIDRLVHSRVAKDTFVTVGGIRYDDTRPDHRARKERIFVGKLGPCLDDSLAYYVKRGDLVSEGSSFRWPRREIQLSYRDEVVVKVTLIRYSGDKTDITFQDQDAPERFQAVCTFSVKFSGAILKRDCGPEGEYWHFIYFVVVIFEGPEVKCFLEWQENGEKKRSKAESAWVDF